MPLRLRHLAPVAAVLALALTGCRSKSKPNFEATVSINGDPGSPAPSEATVADDLRDRLEILSVQREVDSGSTDDGLPTGRLRAKDKDEALPHLDALCLNGALSVRAVHDQSVYLSAAARRDPSKLPADYQILNYTVTAGGKSRATTCRPR
jgi:hypothetical protein